MAAGGVVHVSGSVSTDACPQSDSVTITGDARLFPPDGFGPSVSRDANGDFAIDYTIPTSTPTGSYLIGLRCAGGNVGVSATLDVIGDPIGAPATGAGGAAHGSPLPWNIIGLGSLSLAAGLVMLRRRLGGNRAATIG
jgi:hypothetical protein